MGTGDLQGWHADPFRLHEARYFSAGQPTKLVRDGSAESFDEPPADGWDPAAVAATVTAMATAPGLVQPDQSLPARYHGVAGDAYQHAGAAIRSPRGSRSFAVVGVTLLAAAAVVGGLVITNRHQAAPSAALPTGLSPVAFVTQSAQRTLAQHTADLTLSASFQFAGQALAEHGTGELNFSTDAMAFEIDASGHGHQVDLKEILVDGTAYDTVSIDGKSSQGPGGGIWMAMKVPASGSASSLDGDPYSLLSQIQRKGFTLRPLGMSVIGGVTCTGYAVTDPADEGGSPVTFTIWADSQRLVREMTMGVQMNVPGGSVGLGGLSITIDFSNFGAPVDITAPAPGTTYTL